MLGTPMSTSVEMKGEADKAQTRFEPSQLVSASNIEAHTHKQHTHRGRQGSNTGDGPAGENGGANGARGQGGQ